MLADIRFSLRQLVKARGFTIVAVLTLALGIGATTALFTVVNAVLLRPLPFPRPAELVSIRCDLRGQNVQNIGISVPELDDFQRRSGAFAGVSVVYPMSGNMTGIDRPERVEALAVSTNYFQLLGIAPVLGRTFGAEEESVSGWAQGVVLSYRAWQTIFGGDRGVLGRKIWMDYDTFRIVGVMPPDFRHPGSTLNSDVDVWFTGGWRGAPFSKEPSRAQRRIPGLMARLAKDVSPAQAQSRLDALAVQLRTEFPNDYPAAADWATRVDPLLENLTGRVRPMLVILFGASTCLVLICGASIAGLQLARASARTRETAIRRALGATGFALVRQSLVENLLLALAGGAAGLWLADELIPALLRFAPADLPRAHQIGIDIAVLGFALAVSMATALLLALAPARQAVRVDLVTGLKEGAAGGGVSASAARWRMALVAAQIAVSLVLLAGAGLLVRSTWNLLRADLGFAAKNVLTINVWLPPPSDPTARQTYRVAANRVQFMRSLREKLQALPGVEMAAVGSGQCVPLTGWRPSDLTIEGQVAAPGNAPQAELANVGPGYFHVLGMRLRTGRLLGEADDGTNPVAVIDETAARHFWPDQDPVGRHFAIGYGAKPQWITVVGVVNDMRTDGFDAPAAPHVFISAYHRSLMGLTVLLRSPLPAKALADSVRTIVRETDPDLPIFGLRTLEDVVARAQAQRRFALAVIGFFAVAALLLAALGVFGVIALVAQQRRREFGVRLALGASPRQVAQLVFRQGLTLALAGGVAGLAGSVALTRSLRALLFEASPFDPLTFAAVSGLLAVVVLLACWLPARRAARTDPAEALRAE
jgi:predicted permease